MHKDGGLSREFTAFPKDVGFNNGLSALQPDFIEAPKMLILWYQCLVKTAFLGNGLDVCDVGISPIGCGFPPSTMPPARTSVPKRFKPLKTKLFKKGQLLNSNAAVL